MGLFIAAFLGVTFSHAQTASATDQFYRGTVVDAETGEPGFAWSDEKVRKGALGRRHLRFVPVSKTLRPGHEPGSVCL